MEKSLENKVVVITGGANGIGRGIADGYLQQGAKVTIILDVDEIQGVETVNILTNKHGKGRAEYIKCDITTDLGQISKNVVDKYKTVDVLIMSACFADESVPKTMIDINLTAVIDWSMKFLQHMRKDQGGNGGTIVLISSIFGFRPSPYCPVYQAVKFAINGFTKSLGHADNYEKTGVRVVALCPGFTETKATVALRDKSLQGKLSDGLVKYANSLPWQKIEDVGTAAVEVFNQAQSGTLWLIEGGNPIKEIL